MKPDDPQEQQTRIESMPYTIRRLAGSNSAVNQVLVAYVYGHIITKEEALCQMIVALARDWDVRKTEAYRIAMMSSPIYEKH